MILFTLYQFDIFICDQTLERAQHCFGAANIYLSMYLVVAHISVCSSSIRGKSHDFMKMLQLQGASKIVKSEELSWILQDV